MHGCLRKSATRASMLWANKPLPRMMRLQVVSPQRTKCSALSGSMASHDMFIEEIAVCKSPKRLSSILKALEASGSKTVSPSSREGLHPLLIPLVEDAKTSAVTCLLRWPQPAEYTNMTMPVVSMKRGAVSVTLIARSVDEYLHRMLAEEDEAAGPGGPRPIAAAAGADGESLFKSGDIEAAGFEGKMQIYVVRKVGMFPDVCETLSHTHMKKGDKVSALVASEWYMRNGYFPGWARPYEFAGELLASMGRMEEARDMARVALRSPWWTLQSNFDDVAKLAQLSGTPKEIRYALSEEAAAAAQAQVSKMPQVNETKSKKEVGLARANALMDMVAAGDKPSYEAIRSDLAEAYLEAGFKDVSNFITTTT